jgi:branched-chain amino acid transport system permease protein
MTTDATPISAPVEPRPWAGVVRAIWPFIAALVVAAVMAFAVLPRMNGYHSDEAANCGIAILLAVSLTVVNGFTGQFSIGHSGFLALGGYAAAALVYYGSYKLFGDFQMHGGRLSGGPPGSGWFTRGDALFLIALLFGGVVAAAIGWVVGLPSLRLRGDYLAIVTLGFCEIVRLIMQNTGAQLAINIDPDTNVATFGDPGDLEPVVRNFPQQMTHLGGALGFTTIPTYASIFWICAILVVMLVLTVRLKYSAYGRSMLSIREDDIAAQAVGVNITKFKVRAFVYSAFFAGVAGGLFATQHGVINAGELGFQKSFDYVIMVVLGGLGSISGATVAAILLTLLPEWLRDLDGVADWKLGVVCGALALIGLIGAGLRKWVLVSLCVVWALMFGSYLYFHRIRYPQMTLSDYRMVIYALVLITVMLTRPQGLLGLREVWDYLPAKLRWWERPARVAKGVA